MNGVILRATTVITLLALAVTTSAHGSDRPRRPFETEDRRPRVSPYLNLVNNNQPAATNYQSLVRPQLEQQAMNRNQRAAINRLQRSAAPTRSQSTMQGNQHLRGTGHRTTFDDTSRYYPQLKR